jgi:hypothetical protein
MAGFVAVACGGTLAWRVAAEAPGPEDARTLARSSRQLASLARDTASLADNVLGSRVTKNYARAHREKLAEEAKEQGQALEAPFEPAVQPRATALRGLARELQATLEGMERELAPGPPLEAIRDRAKKLAMAIAAQEPPA